MDVQLQELINKIREEGVQSAEEQAAEIIAKAEERAKGIISMAEERAGEITAVAAEEAKRIERTGKDALAQAGRDLLLNVERRLEALFTTVTAEAVADTLSGGILEGAVLKAVEGMSGSAKLDILLPSRDLREVETALRERLSEKLRSGYEVRPFDGITAGFRISEKDGSSYWDFSAEGIALVLSELLNPRFAELLKNAASGE